jgi:hypothetical protein
MVDCETPEIAIAWISGASDCRGFHRGDYQHCLFPTRKVHCFKIVFDLMSPKARMEVAIYLLLLVVEMQ